MGYWRPGLRGSRKKVTNGGFRELGCIGWGHGLRNGIYVPLGPAVVCSVYNNVYSIMFKNYKKL